MDMTAASQGVEKVTLLLNSFPVKASVITYFLMHSNSFPVKPRASPLSDFEELVAGEDSPVPLPDLIATSPLDEGQTLTPRTRYQLRMPPPLLDVSGDVLNVSILTLWANFSNSLTLLTTVPSVNDFLKAMDGPFAHLRSLVGQHTSTKDTPQFQPLSPLEDVVKNIVQELWGHTSVKVIRGIGNILDEASVIDDLSFEGALFSSLLKLFRSSQHCAVFMETCMAVYAQKRGKSPQEVMKKFCSHNTTDTGQTGLNSQDAASLCKSEHLEIKEKYPDRVDEAKAFYDKVLMHYGDIILSKDERETQPNESLHLLQKMTGKYAAQVKSVHLVPPIGVAVVGFVVDETVPLEQSMVTFTSSPIMAEMVKAMGLPLTKDAALAIRNLYDGIKAFSPYQPDISKQRSFLHHLCAFTNPDNEEFGASGLMKSVVATARQSVHFHDQIPDSEDRGHGQK
ncbi:uncharacterized protein EI90DRAFT_3122639 [Cantharellus anzutake]|uniref:uncharacterized protein n=1 Tax=Cantharellus anzutake TaxID=1750568 RepID=UPI001906A01D|nr:uncharacterized protein EI90DRAFT_3122639 [Cantharellus anzutake]KAF8332860.1 hypothetical protein EI90DRAFT_3122639 [Cantharellus anzutake]